MGWFAEIQAILKAAAGQLTNSSHVSPPGSVDTREPHFTKNFHSVSHARGLTEADARDVYYHGSVIKQIFLFKQKTAYEIGIYYFVDGHTGRTIITSVWKRDR